MQFGVKQASSESTVCVFTVFRPLTEEMIVGEAINLPCSSKSSLLIDLTRDGVHPGKENTGVGGGRRNNLSQKQNAIWGEKQARSKSTICVLTVGDT